MAAGDLCAIADVKEFASITTGNDDALLTSLITNASALVNSLTNRNLMSASYTERFNGRGGSRQGLSNYPVTAVASVTVDGVSIPAATGQTDSGFLFDEHLVYLRGYVFCRGVQNVEITYTGGLESVPADLAQACIEIVATKYKRRTNLEVSGKTLNGETISFTQSDVPPSAKAVLANYTRRFLNA